MTINKDNYEEYFLLFADNELSEKERGMVEDFVKQYTHLEEEFLSIRQSVLQPENDVKLGDKSSLFRHSENNLTHASYEAFFVLYNDDELTAVEIREIEVFLANNPSLKNEFELFQKSKLQPDDTIVFDHKEVLLKREGNVKVIPFGWWRAGAAAVLAGIGLWLAMDLLNDKKHEVPGIVKSTNIERTDNVRPVSSDTATIKEVMAVKENKSSNYLQKKVAKNNIEKVHGQPPILKNSQALKTPEPAIRLPRVTAPQKAAPEQSALNNEEKQVNNSDVVNGIYNNDNIEVQQDVMVLAKKGKIEGAKAALYVSDESENSNNYAFYNVTEEKFNKSKIGGFLRKVKRIVGRKIAPLNNSKDQREMVDN